jgi:hypothetical protein
MIKLADKLKSMAEKLKEVQDRKILKSSEDYIKDLIQSGDIGENEIGKYLLHPIKETTPLDSILPINKNVLNMRVQYDGPMREEDLAIILNRRDGRLIVDKKAIEFVPIQIINTVVQKVTKR